MVRRETRAPMEECEESLRTFHYRPPKGCDMTDDKKNKMVNKGDKEAKKVKVEQLKGVAAGEIRSMQLDAFHDSVIAPLGPRSRAGAGLVTGGAFFLTAIIL